MNDLDGEVVNFFDCLRADPERLASMVSLTPYARQEYENAYTEQSEPFHRAHSFLIRLQMGHGFRTCGERVGWKMDVRGRERAYAVRDWNRLPERLLQAAERLKEVQIESRPALDVIEHFNFPNILIYCDPPYLLGTRCRKQYRCEMTDAEHFALLETLRSHKGKVIISGYESVMYDDMLRGWHRATTGNLANNSRKRTEILWMNFEPEV